jgi:tRNA nucleotidyltransferase (CCA-adding enzyme)
VEAQKLVPVLALVPSAVRHITDTLQKHGKRGWIVGGCVRDLIMGRTPADWDICTDALPGETLKLFPRSIPTGIAHGTVTVVIDREHYEVTTLRGETTYTDGRRPDSVFFVSDIVADLARRDFTVNAIAIDPVTGVVVDPFGGQSDIQSRTIRAVGKADERFAEDGLRVLRAARFSAQLEFDVEPETLAAIARAGALDTYRKVSGERIRDEWMKSMKAKQPSRAFTIMKDTGILAVTCPEMMESVGCGQNRYHTYDVWGHAMACMDAASGDAILRISAMLHDVGKPRSKAFSDKTQDYTFYEHERIGAEMVQPICERLKFSNDEKKRIEDLVRHHMWHYDGWTDAAVRRWIQRVGKDRIEDLYALREADIKGKSGVIEPSEFDGLYAMQGHVERVLLAGAALSVKDLAINGGVLMKKLELKPGRILGEILEALLEEVITDPSLNTEPLLLDRARAFVATKQQ